MKIHGSTGLPHRQFSRYTALETWSGNRIAAIAVSLSTSNATSSAKAVFSSCTNPLLSKPGADLINCYRTSLTETQYEYM